MASEEKGKTINQERLRDFNLFGLETSYQSQDFLIFILQPKSLELKGLNLRAKRIFRKELEQISQSESILETIIQPGDLLKLTSTFHQLEQTEWENKLFVGLDLKINGSVKKYQFEIRKYKAKLPSNSSISPHASKHTGHATEWGIVRESIHKSPTYLKEEQESHTYALCIGREQDSVEDLEPKEDYLPKTWNLLAENQNKYLSLINSIDEGFASIDLIFNLSGKVFDYLFLETNPALQDHVDFDKAAGRTIKELAPHFENYWLETYASVAFTGAAKRFSDYSEGLSNNWFNVFAFPIGDPDHRKVGIIFSNITETKHAVRNLKGMNESLEQKVEQRTDELKENTQLLQIVFDTTNEGLLVLEPIRNQQDEIIDFKYLRTNKVMEELQGISPLEGRHYLEVNPHAATNGLVDVFKDVMNNGVFQDFEFWCEIPNYPGRWYRITARKQYDLLITSMEDITNRKMEAERLKENIRFKKQLAQTSPDLIMIFDLRKEKIQYLNRNLSARPGMRKHEVMGNKITELFSFVHPREREKLIAFHDKIIKGTNDQITDTEFRLRGTDKEWEWYSAVGKVFKRNPNGRVLEYIILLRNIEEQKNIQKALLRAEKLSIKGEVARTFAHELRNPLASIGMATDILKKNLPEDQLPQLENYLQIIRRSTKTLNQLVTDLLTSSNYTQALLQKTCLAQILEETLNLAGDRIYLAGIKVVKNYKGHYFINADAEKLKIALLNIIINASEAMHPDQGILRLKIEKINDSFNLIIKDNGIGMQQDQLDRLFDAFYTQKPDGIGVGMSSVKNILEEHEAEIKVSSVPKKGTQFELYFHCHHGIKAS